MSLHTQYINGALVYYDPTRQRWVDAIGVNVIKYIQDFVSLPVDDTTGDPTEFTITVVEVGAGDSTAALDTSAGGKLIITTAANEDDGLNMQLKGEAFKLESAKPCYFGIKLQVSDATQSDLLVGLCITDTTLLGGMTDGVYFECLDGSTDINFVLEKNSTETTSASAVGTLANATDVTLEFLWDGTYVNCYVDGVEQTRLAITNLPDDEVLTPSIHFLAGEAAAKTCSVEWLRVIQLR